MEIMSTVEIEKNIDDVISFVLDVNNDKKWRYGVDETEMLCGNSFERGSRGRTRVGKTEVDWEIISIVPKVSIDWKFLNGPFEGVGGYRFTELEKGTLFSLYANLQPKRFYFLLGPLFKIIGKKRNDADVFTLKELLESGV